jgi:hypothetical protein
LLGHSHRALGKAVRERRLTQGVRINDDDVVEVVDVGAAVEQWRDIHKVRLDEMLRRDTRRGPRSRSSVLDAILHRYDWTVDELCASHEAHELIVFALMKVLRTGKKVSTAAIVECMREAAPCRFGDDGYDARTVAHAEWLLDALVEELSEGES